MLSEDNFISVFVKHVSSLLPTQQTRKLEDYPYPYHIRHVYKEG
jgi:hypothetical protein